MKNLIKPLVTLCLQLLLAGFAFLHAQTINVSGFAFLENQTNYEGITIKFERVIPGSLIDSVYSEPNGCYSTNIETGVYNITLRKTGYFESVIIEKPLYSNTTIEDVTLMQKTSMLLVPGMFSTIQDAINASCAGDTVIIEPGTYLENINLNGKAITLGSQFIVDNNPNHISQTIIDGSQNGHVVEISNGEDSTTKIIGITITNGYATQAFHDGDGGGIYCKYSTPELSYLHVINNTAEIHGGGIYYSTLGNNDAMIIENCLIQGNTITNYSHAYGAGIFFSGYEGHLINTIVRDNEAASTFHSYGGGVHQSGNALYVKNSLIINNESSSQNPVGGGIYVNTYLNEITNSVIAGNTAETGGGIYTPSNHQFFVSNSIFFDNDHYAIFATENENIAIRNCDFFGNTGIFNLNEGVGLNVTINANGDSCDAYQNIIQNPQFTNITNDNYRLLSSSPCIDAGDNEDVSINFDLDNNFRIWDGNGDTTEIVDMGSYELGSTAYFPITSSFICPDSICIYDTILVEYSGTAPESAAYFWDFDDATIVSGYGPGPYTICWNQSGLKNISLYVEVHGITSSITHHSVTIQNNPLVYAGADTTIFSGDTYVINDAYAQNFETLNWTTSGDGFFNDTTIINPSYTPGANDINNGMVILSIFANSTCGIANDEMMIQIDSYLSLSGSVFCGENYSDSCVALIFEVNEDYYLPIQFTQVISGHYTFDSLETGSYLVYAIPNPFQDTAFFPTYNLDQIKWSDGSVFVLNENSTEVDIFLSEQPETETGIGTISGVVTYENVEVYEENIYQNDWFGNTTGVPYGAWNMCVFLYDEQQDAIAWSLTDESGVFQFSDLPFGQYQLSVEKAGFQISDTTIILLDEINPSVENIEIEISTQNIIVLIPKYNSVKNESDIYPNPVLDWLNIDLQEIQNNLIIEIFTLTGQKVTSIQVDQKSLHVKIDVSSLEKGIYIGRITSRDYSGVFKFMK